MAIHKVFYRSPHNYDVDAASDEATVGPPGESLTVQSQTEDADLNVMMRRFGVTGKLPESVTVPRYGDFSEITDFRSALHVIQQSTEEFMRLPPDLRASYQNSPQLFLEAVESGHAFEALQKAGLTVSNAPGGVSGGDPSMQGSPPADNPS